MPVTYSYIGRDQAQPNGSRSIHEYHVSSDGRHLRYSYAAPVSFDVNAQMAARAPEVNAMLDEHEAEQFNGDPLTAVFFHTSKKKVIRKLLTRAMQDENPKALLMLEPVITWIRANYTGAQIANYLNITIAQAVKLVARFDALVLVASTIDADAPEDFD